MVVLLVQTVSVSGEYKKIMVRTNKFSLFIFVFVILFIDGHVLHLRRETMAVRRRMRNGYELL